ncbi:MAG: DUF692 domain-containing protein [Chromatiales bacterium]|nr:DUF692 domain-containing protein [Chromatiales bacterium]
MPDLASPGITGAGLGLRRALMGPLAGQRPAPVGFFEAVPENWMGIGGRLGRQFRALTEAHPFVTHGLSLDIGGPRPLDLSFLAELRDFLDRHCIQDYTEHLTSCGDHGHLYDLMPVPFTGDAVRHIATRVREVQERLDRRIALENASYYAAPGAEMSEADFVNAVLAEADCDLLLDVNNVFVNSINHGYDAYAFIDQLPPERVRYLHVAGHRVEAEDLRVDTHGADVCPDVWSLLGYTYGRLGPVPTLLERDFNIPPLATLLDEVAQIARLQAAAVAGERERRVS